MTPINLTQYIPLIVDALQRLIPLLGDMNRNKNRELNKSLEELQRGSEGLQQWLEQREKRFNQLAIIILVVLGISVINLIVLLILLLR